MALDLRNLRCAITAAETGSFRRAADLLALPQSSISRRIQHLERRVGFPLFERSRTGVIPTVAGAAFLEGALAGARQMELAAHYAVAVHRGDRGEIRVGIAPSRTGGLFLEVLRQFQTLFPSVNISLTEEAMSKASHDVAMGALDIALLIGAERSPVYETQVLWREAILAVLPKTHHLTNRQNVTWDEIRDETFILSNAERGCIIQNLIITRLTEMERRPKFDIQNISNAGILDLVAMGYGITLADESSVRRIEGLHFIPLAGESQALAASAVWRSDNANPAVPHLIAVAAAVGRGAGKPCF